MTEADVLRRIILEGRKALGEIGVIKKPQHENIIRIANEVDEELRKRVTNIKRPVWSIMVEALLSEYRRDVGELCQNEFSRLWNEFEEAAQAADDPELSGFLEGAEK